MIKSMEKKIKVSSFKELEVNHKNIFMYRIQMVYLK